MKKSSIYFLICAICACNQSSVLSDSKKIIFDVTSKFPQLGNESDYKHTRTIIIGEKEIQIELWSNSDKKVEQHQIAIFKNRVDKVYAIPLFTNRYRSYWNFEFNDTSANFERINTTFNKEVLNMLTLLGFKNQPYKCNEVVWSFFTNLLQSSDVFDIKESVINEYRETHEAKLAEESKDSCAMRVKKNIDAIEKQMNFTENYGIHNAFFDRQNLRIYQIVFDNKFYSKNCDFTIKVYRQDCNIHLFDL